MSRAWLANIKVSAYLSTGLGFIVLLIYSHSINYNLFLVLPSLIPFALCLGVAGTIFILYVYTVPRILFDLVNAYLGQAKAVAFFFPSISKYTKTVTLRPWYRVSTGSKALEHSSEEDRVVFAKNLYCFMGIGCSLSYLTFSSNRAPYGTFVAATCLIALIIYQLIKKDAPVFLRCVFYGRLALIIFFWTFLSVQTIHIIKLNIINTNSELYILYPLVLTLISTFFICFNIKENALLSHEILVAFAFFLLFSLEFVDNKALLNDKLSSLIQPIVHAKKNQTILIHNLDACQELQTITKLKIKCQRGQVTAINNVDILWGIGEYFIRIKNPLDNIEHFLRQPLDSIYVEEFSQKSS